MLFQGAGTSCLAAVSHACVSLSSEMWYSSGDREPFGHLNHPIYVLHKSSQRLQTVFKASEDSSQAG